MTGFDIYESAMLLLGIPDSKGTIERDENFKRLALEVINNLSLELCGAEPVKNLFETVKADNKAKSVMAYGLASFISAYNRDVEKNTVITAIFNAKRTAYLSKSVHIKDASPDIYGV